MQLVGDDPPSPFIATGVTRRALGAGLRWPSWPPPRRCQAALWWPPPCARLLSLPRRASAFRHPSSRFLRGAVGDERRGRATTFRTGWVVVLRGFLDIHERQCAVLFGDIGHLIEPPDSVSHVRGVGERFFALLRK